MMIIRKWFDYVNENSIGAHGSRMNRLQLAKETSTAAEEKGIDDGHIHLNAQDISRQSMIGSDALKSLVEVHIIHLV